ncbi:unnamed protein product [Mytilus edulis]|uniref:Integrase catalytic domain-containing protein n=1 Tax=Mytilus edulis TaxID=6550 RepID=A0A8S3VFQ8_MYTED|nr:unnamed protein product [Mytilus edulis]
MIPHDSSSGKYSKLGNVTRLGNMEIKCNSIGILEPNWDMFKKWVTIKVVASSLWLKTCDECQKQNKKAKTVIPELCPVPCGKRIWGKIGIDLIGPFINKERLPISTNGYRYVITMIDYLSKWPEAFPLYRKEAKEVAEKLSETIYRYGAPDEIISDCGGEFNSKITAELMKNYGIRHITTSPYHPQANGLVENFNQTIKNMINKVVVDNGSDWDMRLGKVLFAYRTSLHKSSRYTPFEAMFIRKPIFPNEADIGPVSAAPEEDMSVEVVEQLSRRRKEIEEDITKNIANAQQQQKEYYDKRHNVDNNMYKISDKVLLKNYRRKHGIGTVEQLRYKGPYIIKQCCGKGNYLLTDLDTRKDLGPYNQKSLKVWNEPHCNNVNTCNTLDGNDEVDENNNNESLPQDKGEDSYSSIVNESNGSGTKRISVDAVIHTENFQNSDEEYPPSAQSAFSSPINPASFDLFDVSLREMFLPNGNHEPDDEIEVIEKDIEISQPKKRKRKTKWRQNSIYEYF